MQPNQHVLGRTPLPIKVLNLVALSGGSWRVEQIDRDYINTHNFMEDIHQHQLVLPFPLLLHPWYSRLHASDIILHGQERDPTVFMLSL